MFITLTALGILKGHDGELDVTSQVLESVAGVVARRLILDEVVDARGSSPRRLQVFEKGKRLAQRERRGHHGEKRLYYLAVVIAVIALVYEKNAVDEPKTEAHVRERVGEAAEHAHEESFADDHRFCLSETVFEAAYLFLFAAERVDGPHRAEHFLRLLGQFAVQAVLVPCVLFGDEHEDDRENGHREHGH